MASSIILNIPHASTLLPVVDIPAPYQEPSGAAYWAWGGKAVVKKRIREKYVAELKYMTDWFVDELFINGVGKPLVAPVSRLLCDMERFKDDMKEEMSIIGMGICYTSTHDLENLAYFKIDHKLEMIKKYYDPYHQALNSYTREAIDENGYALILDCHSFNSFAYKCDKIHKACRPDICIGTDSKHTPPELTDIVVKYFTALGYEVALNDPFSGTMIPQWFDYNDNLYSIMIEINRKLYLDWEKDNAMKSDHFDKLKSQIHDLEKLLELFMKQKCLDKKSS